MIGKSNKYLFPYFCAHEIEVTNEATIKVGKLPLINGFRPQLKQALHNLISNAIKYSRPGVPPDICIEAKEVSGKEIPVLLSRHGEEDTFYLITIQDNGIGFETSDADKIFDVFTRLQNSKSYHGTGVGLAIVHKVIEHHGGYIFAEAQPMEGATFKIFLPKRILA